MLRLALLILCLSTAAVAASDPPPMAGTGTLVRGERNVCSAVLIAEDLVATAAHCGAGTPPGDLTFRTGSYPGHPSVEIRVADVVRHPFYKSPEDGRIGADIALIRLDEPIAPEVAQPFARIGAPTVGERLLIGSYPGGQGLRARERRCPVLDVLKTSMRLSCVVRSGESGAPVLRFTPDGPELVGIVVATGREGHQPYAYVVLTSARLGQLRAILGY